MSNEYNAVILIDGPLQSEPNITSLPVMRENNTPIYLQDGQSVFYTKDPHIEVEHEGWVALSPDAPDSSVWGWCPVEDLIPEFYYQ